MNYILQKVNCKALIVAVLVVASTIASVVVGYAYTMRTIPHFWFDGHYVYVAEGISPRETSYSSVTIDYDDLADLVYYCNEHNLSTSLVYNDAIDRYVGYVSDSALNIRQFNFSSLYGLLGNVDGKVYVAEDPRSNTHITITTPTNPDYTDRLINIASNLDFLPIIAELNVLIADNQLLVMDYIKLAIESIWDLENSMIDHIDDLNTTVNNRLAYIGSRVASVDNHVVGIAEQLGSVIKNGAVQVNTSPIEARLDKLISMYSKVNSVVLDTASVNGGQITGAVGGELQDVIFWGDTGKYNNEFLTPDGLFFRLGPDVTNTTRYEIDDSIVLRSVPVSASFVGDSVVSAGIWQKDSSRILSDTYNVTTGQYIQRVGVVDLGSLSYIYFPYPFNANFSLYHTQTAFLPMRQDIGGGDLLCSGLTNFTSYPASDDNPNKSITSDNNGYLYIRYDEAANSAELLGYVSGMQLLYPLAVPVITQVDPATIAIPEGSSYISSYNVRITGKYETYESFTQTADIITAINNLQLSSSVSTDLTAITTRLDTLINKTSDTVVNVVNNNTYITNVFQLDDDTSVVDTTKDGVGKVSGLFKWLWNNTFKGAFSHADITKLDGLL